MNKYLKKTISLLILTSIIVSGFSFTSINAFADSGAEKAGQMHPECSLASISNNKENDEIRQIQKKEIESAKEILDNDFNVAELSVEAYRLYVNIIRDSLECEGLEANSTNINKVIQTLDGNEFVKHDEAAGETIQLKQKAANKVKLETKVVAAILNTAISVALVAAGAGAGKGIQALVKSLIKKYGKKHAKKLIAQKVTTAVVGKLVSLGITKKVAAGIATFITNCVLSYADPGGQIAKYLDKKDGKLDGYISL